MNKLTDRDVRVIYLPPMTAAAYRYIGGEPEMHCNQVVDTFVRTNDLSTIKPDLRHFGFTVDEDGQPHGYEIWISVPDDFLVSGSIIAFCNLVNFVYPS